MKQDNRRSRRQPIRYSAWIVLEGGELQGCALADASDTGARLEVENPESLPERFELLLSKRNLTPRRFCHVVWRKEKQIGVNFEHQLTMTEAAPASAGSSEPAKSA
ncbi:MAG TPA: PilZ domain-containing protein [Pseudolabrys sp.]|nr:PilZ domain-containing protein [Pseudolabrys sp.]